MAPSFCIDALEEALHRYGTPDIFNSDQGAQFTSDEFIAVLERSGTRISMDGKVRRGIGDYFAFFNDVMHTGGGLNTRATRCSRKGPQASQVSLG